MTALAQTYDVLVEPDGQLALRYVPLSAAVALEWAANPKLHDQEAIVEAIVRYGFQDPPKLSAQLNDGRGGLVFGNGRTLALAEIQRRGLEPPANIAIHEETGEWCIPVLVGNDLRSRALAESFAIDHNMLTVTAADVAVHDLAKMWDNDLLNDVLTGIQKAEADTRPVTLSADDVRALLAGVGVVEELTQGRWDVPDPKKHDPAPDYSMKPLPDTTCSLNGRLVFLVPREVYLAWLDDIRLAISFVPEDIVAEIIRRLGLAPLAIDGDDADGEQDEPDSDE